MPRVVTVMRMMTCVQEPRDQQGKLDLIVPLRGGGLRGAQGRGGLAAVAVAVVCVLGGETRGGRGEKRGEKTKLSCRPHERPSMICSFIFAANSLPFREFQSLPLRD